MILTVIDPALLTYDCKDLDTGKSCCLERLEALTNHRVVIKKYNLRIAMSEAYANFILSQFPWKQSGNNALHDLREFILIDLQKKAYYMVTDEDEEVEISPKGVLCQYVDCQDLVCAWGQILIGCVREGNTTQYTSNIATWRCPSIVSKIELIIVEPVISKTKKAGHKCFIPLVWDYDSWANQLITQDWWPDLNLMVELTYITNTAIRNHVHARASPMNFDCSEGFWQSANNHCCDDYTRRSFVEALTKLLYGVYDKGLSLEPVKSRPGVYRFRVTRSVRVHYHMEGGKLMIDAIGPHKLDSIG